MLGAIIGDMASSVYERNNFKNNEEYKEVLSKDNLIDDDCKYTKDTILNLAVLDTVLFEEDYADILKKYGLEYMNEISNNKGSEDFIKWCYGENIKSDNNDALRRVSSIGYLYNDLDSIIKQTDKLTKNGYDTALAISSARVLNSIIYSGRMGNSLSKTETIFCPISRPIDKIRLSNKFNPSCAILSDCEEALFQSVSFEDAVRKAISLGGNVKANAVITGSMAEAFYEIPSDLKNDVLNKLPDEFDTVLIHGYEKVKKL